MSVSRFFLRDLLALDRLASIVDVGANPIDGDPPYKQMLADGLCTVTGFEPQPDALAELQHKRGPLETYLPHAIGDGDTHTLRITSVPGMSSLLEPDPRRLALFNGFSQFGEVTDEHAIATRRLDDVNEVATMDLLKIDVQGSELMVFEGAERLLRRAVAVHTEVSFVPLYRDQPCFGVIDGTLRTLGFIPHKLAALKRWSLSPVVFNGNFRVAGNQLLEADIVYVRDFGEHELMSNEQLGQLAMIASHVYGSVDLVYRCLAVLSARGELADNAGERYLASLNNDGK